MPYEVTFTNGRTVTVYNTEFLSPAQVELSAIALYGAREYRWSEEHKRAMWVDCEVPAIKSLRQMVEVYQGGGYCLVPA